MKKVIIFGIGQFSETISVYLEQDDRYDIIGYTVDKSHIQEAKTIKGRPVVPWEELEQQFNPRDVLLLGPISYRNANRFRKQRFLEGKKRGFSFLTYIHPDSHIYTEHIGENCIILERNIIQPFARIGDNVIIWSANHIGHHSVIEDHCFIAGMVGVAGNSHIGEGTFLGGQSGVGDNIKVGAGSILGVGANIVSDIMPDSIVIPPSGRIIKNAATRFAKYLL